MTILDCRLPLDATGSPPALTSLRRLDDALVYDPRPPCGSRRTRTGSKYDCSWEGFALPDPPAGGGMGKPGFPIPLLQRQSVSTKVTAPSLTLPAGGGNPAPPPSGGRLGGGQNPANGFHLGRGAPREPPGGRSRGRRRRGGETPPLCRPASRQGLRPPRPSRGWENGETGFPHSPLREPMFTLGVNHAYRTDRTQTDRTAVCHAL